MGRFVWFLLGAAVGATAMALVKRVEEEKEVEDFEQVAESLQKRLEGLEREFGASK